MEYKNFIGIFGGAFSPLTNSHFKIAQSILDEFNFEKVIFLPVGDKYNKLGLMPSEIRLQIISRVIENNQRLDVSDVEITAPYVLRTIESLEILSQKYPNNQIAFIMGYDNLANIRTWYNFEGILENFYIIVASYDLDYTKKLINTIPELKDYKEKIILLEHKIESNIRSSYVRNMIKQNKDIEEMVPNEAYGYLKEIGWV